MPLQCSRTAGVKGGVANGFDEGVRSRRRDKAFLLTFAVESSLTHSLIPDSAAYLFSQSLDNLDVLPIES